MTREEAIVQIKGLKEYCEDMADSDESGSYVFDLDVQALDIALTALRPVSREQVEKVWREEWRWVGEDRWSDTYECSKCGKLSMNDYLFCPNCNSAMNDEAVDMVMERLEALQSEIR